MSKALQPLDKISQAFEGAEKFTKKQKLFLYFRVMTDSDKEAAHLAKVRATTVSEWRIDPVFTKVQEFLQTSPIQLAVAWAQDELPWAMLAFHDLLRQTKDNRARLIAAAEVMRLNKMYDEKSGKNQVLIQLFSEIPKDIRVIDGNSETG